ncbi:hypothetical protein [Photobacterium damselae]|uniref:hypothetical protein n=1 Tax=Photobacterium damselae TaxID=38293 RepID=UPI0015A0C0D6|nr:hypothetical protein [Photobacterium damselae]NVO59512.1 hypothetical protein [Photobacterium damselae subsp. damselae]
MNQRVHENKRQDDDWEKRSWGGAHSILRPSPRNSGNGGNSQSNSGNQNKPSSES